MGRAEPAAAPGWARRLPGVWRLRHYRLGWLRGDLLAGVVVSAYLIPQVMAYAELAGLPAITGVWAAVGPLAVYAVLGSSRQLSVGPEASTALMTAAAVGALSGGDPRMLAAAASGLALATGVVCLLGFLGRIGYVADLLSRPVLTGYMCGIAILMIVSQLGKISGISVPSGPTVSEVAFWLTHLGQANPATLVLSVLVVVLLAADHRWFPQVPGTLLAMVGAAVVVGALGAERLGIALVGPIPRGLPSPALPELAGLDLLATFLAALGIAAVGFTDNVLTGRAFARRHGEDVDAGQELLALGAANVASSLFQGFPVSSSGSRTAIVESSGSRTQLTSLTAVVMIILSLLVLGPVLSAFPLAALGGVVIFAATRLIDIAGFRRLAHFRTGELVLALATTAAVLLAGVLWGIAIAVGLSILDLLRRIARPHDAVLGFAPGVAGMHDVDDYPEATQVPGLVVYRYDSPLFFADADNFRRRALEAVDQGAGPARWLVLNAEANIEIDSTAVEALEDLRSDLERRGVTLALARVKYEVHQSLQKAGFLDRLGPDRVFATLPTAVAAYREWAGSTR